MICAVCFVLSVHCDACLAAASIFYVSISLSIYMYSICVSVVRSGSSKASCVVGVVGPFCWLLMMRKKIKIQTVGQCAYQRHCFILVRTQTP